MEASLVVPRLELLQVADAVAREKGIERRQASLKARQYAEEIAANYSHAFIRFMEAALARLWNRLYDGVVFGHVETLEQPARDPTPMLCVPCRVICRMTRMTRKYGLALSPCDRLHAMLNMFQQRCVP